jgi:hypothetical protein
MWCFLIDLPFGSQGLWLDLIGGGNLRETVSIAPDLLVKGLSGFAFNAESVGEFQPRVALRNAGIARHLS